MSTKQSVLEWLAKNSKRYVSGEEIAEGLNISRSAVWKAINALRKDGNTIIAANNAGYKLVDAVLSAQRILAYATHKYHVIVMDSTTSTNLQAKRIAQQGAEEGTVVVALEQTNGRGRLDRKFYSPAGCGAYFSFVVRPKSVEIAKYLTVIAADAVAMAIEKVGGAKTAIKWVNDVYANGKKCCGILTEASFDMERGGIQYAVVGVGINATTPPNGYPEWLNGVAGPALEGVDDALNKIIAAVLNAFFDLYENFDIAKIAKIYKAKSFLIGKTVDIDDGNCVRTALVLDIDNQCRLNVQFEDGSVKALTTGEANCSKIAQCPRLF